MANLSGEKLVARILNRRGNRLNLPQPLEPGELGWCLDTRQLFVGLDAANAIPAIQSFSNVDSTDVNTILNNYIVTFKTPWIRLKTPQFPIPANPNEVDALTALASVPPSSFITENNKSNISQIEDNISIISKIRQWMQTSVGTAITDVPANVPPMTYVYDWAQSAQMAATATATLNAGAVTAITVDDHGRGYLGGQSLTVTINSDTGSLATASATVDADTGNIIISGLTPGSGYLDATVVIQPPSTTAEVMALEAANDITDDVYQFTFHILMAFTAPNATAMTAAVNEFNYSAFTFKQGNGPVGDLFNDVNGFQTVLQTCGILGYNPSIPNDYNKQMADGILYLETVRQTSNVAGLINKYSSGTGSGLVTSKQNVEVLNEYSASFFSSMMTDLFVVNPLSYKLVPTNGQIQTTTLTFGGTGYSLNDVLTVAGGTGTGATLIVTGVALGVITSVSIGNPGYGYTAADPLTVTGAGDNNATFTAATVSSAVFNDIQNDGSDPLYISGILEYGWGINDVQLIEYSITDSTYKMLRNGTLRVTTLDTLVAVVDDDYSENRDASITPVISGGPNFDFSASVSASKVTLSYRHNFPDDVFLKVTTRRWKSFNV